LVSSVLLGLVCWTVVLWCRHLEDSRNRKRKEESG
jgi:hypothetical protein